MRLITESSELTEAFDDLIAHYDNFYCCVAWAGAPKSFIAGKHLLKYTAKIKKATIGLHFYQTHPDFISTFIDNNSIRYVMETDGVFHDKIYLFSNSPKDWCVIVGSSNFTRGGFENNSETNIVISEADDKGGNIYKSLIQKIDKTFKKGVLFNEKMLIEYRECYEHQKGKQESLSSIVKTPKRIFDSSELILMTWDEYCALLHKDPKLAERMELLKEMQGLFKKHKSLKTVDIDERRNIAGYVANTSKYAHFGTTKRWTPFGEVLENDIEHLSIALDYIPLKGEVTKEHYRQYLSYFTKLGKNWLASATRLLAMKRPDVFVCIDSRNRELLAKYLAIPKSNLTLDRYWDLVVEPIRQSSWYTTDTVIQGTNYWPYRVALLDALIYEPK